VTDHDPEFRGDRRFEVRRRLGTGGKGVVYAVDDRERGVTVALKTLHRRDAGSLYRFKKEFRTLADVAHPNLVSLYELFADDHRCYFTMELVEGVDFVSHVRRRAPDAPRASGSLDLERLRPALRQLALGVQALHDAGKLHRDLKPSNVLVTGEGRVVILDFGVATDAATTLRPQTLDTELPGSLVYASPEQLRGEEATPASDWYGVGVLLFEALTGRLPFSGPITKVLVDKLNHDPPSPASSPESSAPEIPSELAALCRRLMSRAPSERPGGEWTLGLLGDGDDEPPESGYVRLERREGAAVGREAQLAFLADAYADSRAGRAVAVYVHGGAGAGKTALLHAFLERVASREGGGDEGREGRGGRGGEGRRPVILLGRCYEREQLPFKALDGVVDSLSKYLRRLEDREVEALLPDDPGDLLPLTRLFPVLLRVDALARVAHRGREVPDRRALRRHAFSGLRQLFAHIAQRRPLVLFIDDLEWADADSAALLDDLLRPPDPPPLLLLAGFRSEELAAKPFLRQLLERTGTDACRELRVAPLSDAQAAALATELLGTDAGELEPRIAGVVREAGGSPFLIEQLVSQLRASGPGAPPGAGLSEMLDARLRQLPAGAEELLHTLAAAGRPIDASLAHRAAALDGDERPLVAALRAASLVRSSGTADRVELYHDRLRHLLAARLEDAATRRIHLRLAEELLRRGDGDPEALAEHFRRGGDPGRAVRQTLRAARRASAALAFDRAAHLFRQALELGDLDAGERFELTRELASSLADAGRPVEAAAAFLEAAELTGGEAAFRGRLRAAGEYLAGGRHREGVNLLRELLASLGLRLPERRSAALLSLLWQRLRLRLRGLGHRPRERAEVPAERLLEIDACWAAASSLATVRPILAGDFQTRHLRFALDAGEPGLVARALAVEASWRARRGGPARRGVEELGERALEIARRSGDPFALGLSLLQTGVAAYLTGDFRAAADRCDRAARVFADRCTGVLRELTAARRFTLAARAHLGEVAELRRRVPAMLAEAEERGNVLGATELRTRLHLAWLAADDPEGTHREASRAVAELDGFHLAHYNALLARVQADLYAGDAGAAEARLADRWPTLRRSLLLHIQLLRIEARFLRGRVALAAATPGIRRRGDRRRGSRRRLRRAERDAARLDAEKVPHATPFAALLRAGATHLDGDRERARTLLGEAAEGFTAAGLALHAAAARWRCGELTPGDDGRRHRAGAEAWLRGQRVERPERFVAMLAPGFGPPAKD